MIYKLNQLMLTYNSELLILFHFQNFRVWRWKLWSWVALIMVIFLLLVMILFSQSHFQAHWDHVPLFHFLKLQSSKMKIVEFFFFNKKRSRTWAVLNLVMFLLHVMILLFFLNLTFKHIKKEVIYLSQLFVIGI